VPPATTARPQRYERQERDNGRFARRHARVTLEHYTVHDADDVDRSVGLPVHALAEHGLRDEGTVGG
jgi:hypothetical protein